MGAQVTLLRLVEGYGRFRLPVTIDVFKEVSLLESLRRGSGPHVGCIIQCGDENPHEYPHVQTKWMKRGASPCC